jgi:hypothetical protein
MDSKAIQDLTAALNRLTDTIEKAQAASEQSKAVELATIDQWFNKTLRDMQQH